MGSTSEVRAHWEREAAKHGTHLDATTKTDTAKRLEIDALVRAFRARGLAARPELAVLEVGCGNGHNLLQLAEALPRASLTGVDYVPAMIEAAETLRAASPHRERLAFHVGDVLALDALAALRPHYGAIVSDRCLINLDSTARQRAALLGLAARLAPDGFLFAIENSRETYELQNDCRERVGLPRRTPAAFNHFFEEEALFPELAPRLELVGVEDFISLHDLVLYVLVPATNGGRIEYGHPLVEAATRLLLALPDPLHGAFGRLGQNRLYTLRRRDG